MSLQVWLPLNGDLHNQGLSDTTITNNGATVSTDGKIGSCYNFTDGQITLSKPTNFPTQCKQFSVCYWVRLNDTTSYSSWDDYWHMGANSGLFRHEVNTGNKNWIGIMDSVCSTNSETSLTTGTWYHFATVFDITNSLMSVYINGVLTISKTFSSQSYYATGNNIAIGQSFNFDMNDFRIYDHCLSQTEVREIAQGLCLHYKLSGFEPENLLVGTQYQAITATGTGTTNQCDVLYYFSDFAKNNYWSNLDSGSTYTITLSCDWTAVNSTTGTFQLQLAGYPYTKVSDSINLALVPVGSDYSGHISKTVTVQANSSYTSNVITLQSRRDNCSSGYLTFSNVKIAIGSTETDWSPSSEDSSIEYDCSGFGNNGVKTGSIIFTNDTKRYSTSYKLSDSASAIFIGNLSTMVPEGIFTMNIWFKRKTGEWSTKKWETIFGGPSGFELETKNSSTNSPCIYEYSWGKSQFSFNLDQWNMLTMVRTSADTKFYLNGVLQNTASAGTIPSGNYYFGAWSTATGQNYLGYLSDARIYTTALSAEDIKNLYNNAVSADSNEIIHAYEFQEV